MFDRFDDDALRAMNLARQEAQRFGHDFLEAEHIVLGMLQVSPCTAVRMLESLGADLVAVRSRVEARLTARKPMKSPNQLPFTHRSKKVLELSMEQAEMLGDNYIGTEHLLLAYAALDGQPADTLGADLHGLRSTLQSVPRGEKVTVNTAYKDPTKVPWDDPRLFGPPSHQVQVAAGVCDLAHLELVRQQRFEHAARVRDISAQLKQLALELLKPQ